ncbi:MAG TPA: tricarballylate utilization 4Fe-4S protein TcuB [Acidimicrobiales bacterium]|jgi:citrate/tricarballylate utilization protein|nr:tricarballylate utilization 4Fe-4S protein TcuB [Acidimicrobiales bacterium]
MSVDAPHVETRRQLEICDACRFCEGLCAVFPALERRGPLTDGDIGQLANLCHDCRACFEVCMYAPPHPFGVNLPQMLAARRGETIASLGARTNLRSDRPRRGSLSLLAFLAALGTVVFGVIVTHRSSKLGLPPASPYRVVDEPTLLIASGAAALVGIVGAGLGGHRFWRAIGGRTRDLFSFRAWRGAIADAATLRYLGGPTVRCASGSERTGPRRVLHQALVIGLSLTLASTIAAAILGDLAHHPPPYRWASVPVVLGSVGGVLLIGGSIALRRLDRRRDPAPGEPSMGLRNAALLDALALLGASGLAALMLRSTPAGGPVLVLHLVVVWSTLLIAACSKLAHAQYRLLALVRDRIERDPAQARSGSMT